MIDNEPNLVTSGKSQRIIVDGYPFSIEIYRLENEKPGPWKLLTMTAQVMSGMNSLSLTKMRETLHFKRLKAKGRWPL
ncbi:hypothetical protein [Profundibacter sp.]